MVSLDVLGFSVKEEKYLFVLTKGERGWWWGRMGMHTERSCDEWV